MEQPRRRGRIALIALGALLAGALGVRSVLTSDAGSDPEPEASVPRLVGEEEHVTAEVLNGTPRRGLARLVTRVLRRGGLDIVYFGTAPEPAPRTQVLVRRGSDTLVAARVARALGAGTVRVATAPERRVDLSVILGDDYRPPPTHHP